MINICIMAENVLGRTYLLEGSYLLVRRIPRYIIYCHAPLRRSNVVIGDLRDLNDIENQQVFTWERRLYARA